MTNLSTENDLGYLKEVSPGELVLSGVLDYRTGKKLYMIGNSTIHHSTASHFTLDCSGITRTSSVGLSLILSLIRDAQTLDKKLLIKNLPIKLEEIARFSGVIDILPLTEDFKILDDMQVAR